ncbi:MAG: Na+/H+ antiporter subunit E [Flavobacteriaceae bacterium]|nr:Na+/H+ antiporter subunit E [Flavobacteriaceae bacterium]
MSAKKNIPTLKRKSTLGKFIYTFIIMFLIWLGFTTSFEPAELITGVVVSLVIAFFTDRIFSCCGMKVLMPHKIFYFIQYFIIFIFALIKANFDVAKRVISPELPINPGIVKFKTKLTNGFARMVLANSITLTPGTLTIDAIGDTFYVHWIDVTSDDPKIVYKEIAESFEKILIKIYED